MEAKKTVENQSVERAFQIIEIVAKKRGRMRLLDIADKVRLPASTVLRYLATLMPFYYSGCSRLPPIPPSANRSCWMNAATNYAVDDEECEMGPLPGGAHPRLYR